MGAGENVWISMECPNKMDCQKGFTLIELLFAVFIFTIVVSIVYGSYRTTFNTIHNAEDRLKDVNRTRVITERFSEDLQGLVRGVDTILLGETSIISGQRGDNIQFLTTGCLKLSRDERRAGPCIVSYESELDEESGWLNLYRSESTVLPGGEETGSGKVRKNIIGKDLREIRIKYLAKDGNESDEWSTTAADDMPDGGDNLPEFPLLITLELFYGDSPDEDLDEVPQFHISVQPGFPEKIGGQQK